MQKSDEDQLVSLERLEIVDDVVSVGSARHLEEICTGPAAQTIVAATSDQNVVSHHAVEGVRAAIAGDDTVERIADPGETDRAGNGK